MGAYDSINKGFSVQAFGPDIGHQELLKFFYILEDK